MRTLLQADINIERSYIETHIASVVKIGLDYGFDISVVRYSSYTIVSLKQFYSDSPRMMDSVEVTLYHDHRAVEVERVGMHHKSNKTTRCDRAVYEDYNAHAIDHIMRIVWDIETCVGY